MTIAHRLAIALLLASGPSALEAQERVPALRAILGNAEVVVRGRVLDQEPAPGGLWHRFLVEEVIWPVPGSPGAEDPGPTLRLFAHGDGMPEGAALRPEEELIVGASWLPPESADGLPAFLAGLWRSFRADRPAERPALVAPDGILPAGGDPGEVAESARLIRTLRDPGTDPGARRETLIAMAGHRDPAFREEALRQLARPEAGLDGDGLARVLSGLRRELEGEAHPAVLAAHLDLIEEKRPPGAGPILSGILRSAPGERIASRAGMVLARVGTAADLRALSRDYPAAEPAVKARILRTLAIAGGLERRDLPAAGARPGPAEAGRLDGLLRSARERLRLERTGEGDAER